MKGELLGEMHGRQGRVNPRHETSILPSSSQQDLQHLKSVLIPETVPYFQNMPSHRIYNTSEAYLSAVNYCNEEIKQAVHTPGANLDELMSSLENPVTSIFETRRHGKLDPEVVRSDSAIHQFARFYWNARASRLVNESFRLLMQTLFHPPPSPAPARTLATSTTGPTSTNATRPYLNPSPGPSNEVASIPSPPHVVSNVASAKGKEKEVGGEVSGQKRKRDGESTRGRVDKRAYKGLGVYYKVPCDCCVKMKRLCEKRDGQMSRKSATASCVTCARTSRKCGRADFPNVTEKELILVNKDGEPVIGRIGRPSQNTTDDEEEEEEMTDDAEEAPPVKKQHSNRINGTDFVGDGDDEYSPIDVDKPESLASPNREPEASASNPKQTHTTSAENRHVTWAPAVAEETRQPAPLNTNSRPTKHVEQPPAPSQGGHDELTLFPTTVLPEHQVPVRCVPNALPRLPPLPTFSSLRNTTLALQKDGMRDLQSSVEDTRASTQASTKEVIARLHQLEERLSAVEASPLPPGRAEVLKLQERLDASEAAFEKANGAIKALEKTVLENQQALDGRIAELQQRSNDIVNRLTELVDKLTQAQNTNVASLESRLAAFEDKFFGGR
ncbi:hypothetical protein CPC08DRAFT_817430 [Agrocybe pediades]|nr:hypothetical protein CPC08DRAFT_817430 [Agrocybe pediades]